MTYAVERLSELRRHLDHLKELRPRVETAGSLRRDLSLHNDVLYSLLTVCQLVIDLAGELASHQRLRFEDYRGAIQMLAAYPEFGAELLGKLELLPGFRNVLVHEYVTLDLERVVAALDGLAPVEEFLEICRTLLPSLSKNRES